MKKALLFLNGEEPLNFPDLTLYRTVYCTDGAYNYLKKNSVEPDFVLGDMDSILEKPLSAESIFLEDQNYTDFDKVVNYIKNDFDELDVYGASGKEQDHFLGNLSVAVKYKNDIKLIFKDNFQTYMCIESIFETEIELNKTVSLIPLSKVVNVCTEGLAYNLNKDDLEFGSFISIRNKAISNYVKISHDHGDLIVFMEN